MIASPPRLVRLDQVDVQGQGRDDVREDDDRHPLADAALSDELAEPHHERRAGGERQDDEQHVQGGEIRDQVDRARRAPGQELPRVEQEDEPRGLHQCETDGEIARRLGELALSDRSLVSPFGELRDHGREQLDDDRRRDVGHDPEPQHGGAGQGTAREQVQEAEQPLALRGVRDRVDRLEAHPGNGDVRAELVNGDDEQREEDLVAQVRHADDVLQASEHARPSRIRWGRTGQVAPTSARRRTVTG